MIISINQPAYIPWLGYFDRINQSDIHVILDHVQFEKNSMVNRNKIRTRQGTLMLTVPVLTSGKFGNLPITKIEVAVNQSRWNRKHWQAILQSYSKTKYFDSIKNELELLYMEKWEGFNNLLRKMNEFLLSELSIHTKIIYSSELGIEGKKNELILNICRTLDASNYISGPMGRNYLDLDSFHKNGINVSYHDYKHPTYSQFHGDFIPNLSILDLLFNHGKDSLQILSSDPVFSHQ